MSERVPTGSGGFKSADEKSTGEARTLVRSTVERRTIHLASQNSGSLRSRLYSSADLNPPLPVGRPFSIVPLIGLRDQLSFSR